MGLIVQKFGGTSVADSEKIKNVANAVIKEKLNGNDVVVVVSAMGHTTDNLIKLSKEITHHPQEREMDMLMSTGELISMSLLAMAINEKGYKAISLNGRQAGIQTENCHMCARIVNIDTKRIFLKYLFSSNKSKQSLFRSFNSLVTLKIVSFNDTFSFFNAIKRNLSSLFSLIKELIIISLDI